MKTLPIDRLCRVIVCRSASLMLPVTALLMTISASPVFAQDDALRPPTTREPTSSPKFIVIGIVVLLAGLVVFVATLKSKRGHQD